MDFPDPGAPSMIVMMLPRVAVRPNARRLGFSLDRWRRLAPVYESLGMPRADAVAKHRYWPAVRAFLDRHNGMIGSDGRPIHAPEIPDGKEAGNGFKAKSRKRAGT